LNILDLKLSDITPYENNPRNNDEAVEPVLESIKEFGFKVPIIIDKNNVIVAGHTRYKAAKKLKLDTVPCIRADDLTEEQIRAFRLADNKVSEFAKWDNQLLNIELDEIDLNMSLFGFEFVEEEEKEEVEVEFTETLNEEHNYIVLYFDNDIDWLQAESLFNIKTVKDYSTRKDGVIKKERKGIGRVLNGAEALNKLTEVYFNEN
jgi:hypothetical protein